MAQNSRPGSDGGITNGLKVIYDENSREGAAAALGHEIFHFMLGLYPDNNDAHHRLKGLLGRPFTYPYVNNNIWDC